jgi:dTDP-4-dehydrorhamnose reductase
MKILITGANGQLGCELQAMIASGMADIGPIDACYHGAQVVPTDFEELDITNAAACEDYLANGGFDVVINCAAATNVDGCEENTNFAARLNAEGPANLARACAANGATLVHISTDYVLDGGDPMPQPESAMPNPHTVYGRTKLDGEMLVQRLCPQYYLVRTAWLYGAVGKNFVRTMARLGREREVVRVVADQHGSPTNANDLAYEILALIPTKAYGLYHATNNGACTWADFTEAIFARLGLTCRVERCTTAEYAAPAARPAWSILDNKHLRDTIGDKMRSWDVALDSYIEHQRESLLEG